MEILASTRPPDPGDPFGGYGHAASVLAVATQIKFSRASPEVRTRFAGRHFLSLSVIDLRLLGCSELLVLRWLQVVWAVFRAFPSPSVVPVSPDVHSHGLGPCPVSRSCLQCGAGCLDSCCVDGGGGGDVSLPGMYGGCGGGGGGGLSLPGMYGGCGGGGGGGCRYASPPAGGSAVPRSTIASDLGLCGVHITLEAPVVSAVSGGRGGRGDCSGHHTFGGAGGGCGGGLGSLGSIAPSQLSSSCVSGFNYGNVHIIPCKRLPWSESEVEVAGSGGRGSSCFRASGGSGPPG